MKNFLYTLFHKVKKDGDASEEPQFIQRNVNEWIEKEKPYQHMTEEDKEVLPKIGTSINKVARSGGVEKSIHIFDRLIRDNILKEDIVIYRGAISQNYESLLAQKHNLESNYLYYDGYVFCSLNADTYYWNHPTRMIISLPAGSHYLFTGEYSNTPESNEIILARNSILRINKEQNIGTKHYIWAELVNLV